jgi:hypothetical protein
MKKWMLMVPVLPLLAGCLQDTASYELGARDHAITLVRNQSFPWSELSIEAMVMRMPDCNGGGRIEGVDRESKITLYRAPDEYPEPIFLLKTGKQVFALSDQSCRMQKFEEAPDDLGEKLGQFAEKDGKFQFVATGKE